jgi:hypothetical protein
MRRLPEQQSDPTEQLLHCADESVLLTRTGPNLMKKLLASAATLLLAFGSVALSTNIASADDAVVDSPPAVVETTTDVAAPPAEDAAPEAEPVEAEPVETEPVEVAEPADTVEPAPEVATESSPTTELVSAEAQPALAASPMADVGIIGTLYPNSSSTNDPDYWETSPLIPHQAQCYKHEGGGGEHGTVTNNGKTVVLNTFNQNWPGDHWELLVVKAGGFDAVTVHPQAGVEYAAYQYKDVSHWIVCKGIKPASAEIVVNPGTCTAPGSVSGGATVNAVFGNPTYNNGQYTIVATATDGAKFPAGPGVSNDGTKKTFTGARPAQLGADQCVASAAVQVKPPTCEAPGFVVGINPVNATFGNPSYNGTQYTIVATATGSAKFPAGGGVSPDGTTKTFTGQVLPQLPGSECNASASVSATSATCGADGYVTGINPVNATFGAPQYANGTYTIVATATGIAKFAAGAGVSPDGKTKTFTGPYQLKLSDADCVASANVQVKPATCAADGYVLGTDAVNATFGTPTYVNGEYTIVATATGVATFPAGNGVSPDGKTKTFTGSYAQQLDEDDCVASAAVVVDPATCGADGFVTGTDAVNATFSAPTYENGQYTIVATATGVATFPAGPGVSPDGTTKTFTGPFEPQLTEEECVASASVQVSPPTCAADGYVVGVDTVNATFGSPSYVDGQYTIVATATGVATFPAGPGVSPDGTTKTFVGFYDEQLSEEECLASASVQVKPATCAADGYVIGTDAVNATFGDPIYESGQYTIVATATGIATFAPGEGVSPDGTTKTFTGEYAEKLGVEECELPDLDLVVPTISFTQPNCFVNGTYTVGGADVQWSRDGQPIANGTYSLASGVEIELTVAPKPPHGFSPEQQTSWPVSFAAPASPCELTTLALTGAGSDQTAPIFVAGFAVLLGLAAVYRARRTRAVR